MPGQARAVRILDFEYMSAIRLEANLRPVRQIMLGAPAPASARHRFSAVATGQKANFNASNSLETPCIHKKHRIINEIRACGACPLCP